MVKLDAHYVDPRLVALYDRDNPRGIDTDFYLNLAEEINAQCIVDLGCGTGLLICEFATPGRKVIGVDPAPAMLEVARQKPRAERIRWINGDASAIGTPDADLAVMTGNVAQVFLDDDEWQKTLNALHTALRPGGILAFESRNPKDHAWERWDRESTYEQFDSPNGPMECWLDVVHVGADRVQFEAHNVFQDTGEDVIVRSELRFRTLEEISESLNDAGFTVAHVYGDWHKGPLLENSRLMIFVAHRD